MAASDRTSVSSVKWNNTRISTIEIGDHRLDRRSEDKLGKNEWPLKREDNVIPTKGSAWFSGYTSHAMNVSSTTRLPHQSFIERVSRLLELSCMSHITPTASGQESDWGYLPSPTLHKTGVCLSTREPGML